MRRLVTAIVVATVAAVLPVTATAAPRFRTLTVQGPGNTYADVSFSSRVRLATSMTSEMRPRYTATGTYAGVYVTPVHGPGPAAGTFLMRAFRMLSDLPFPLGPVDAWLPPGRYRVHLLGDAPATVRISVEGLGRDVSVRTATPSPVHATLLQRGVAGVSAPADRTIVPFTVGPDTVTVVASVHESSAFAGRREVCVRERTDGLSPCLDGNAGRGWYYSVVPIEWGIGGAAAYHPGELPAGPSEVEFLDVTVGAPKALQAFVMTLS
jgi:hypothetical protein